MEEQLTTVTQKGQITLPISMRKTLGIKPYSKVVVRISENVIKVEPIVDIMNFAGFIKVPKGKDALKAREYMSKHYKG